MTALAQAKAWRSGRPHDLRTEGLSSEVERYWDTNAFVWNSGSLFIKITQRIRISSAAVIVSGFKPGDKVMLGRNSSYLAIRKTEESIFTLRKENNGSRSLYVNAPEFIENLKAEEWDLTDRLPVVWDKRNEMLVAKKPAQDRGRR